MALHLTSYFIFLILLCFSDVKSYGGLFRRFSISRGYSSSTSGRSHPAPNVENFGGRFGQGSSTYTRSSSNVDSARSSRGYTNSGSYDGFHPSPHPGYSYQPGHHYNPAVTHITVNTKSNRGIGEIAKEAFVHGVTTAAVNRMIYGPGIYGTWYSPWGSVPGHFHSNQVVNNYYYTNNNGAESSPLNSSPSDAAPGFITRSGQKISLTEFQQLTEDLLKKDMNNATRFITVKLQGQKMGESDTDDAPERFLTVNAVAWSVPTIRAVLDLYNNYNMDVRVKEIITDDRKKKEDIFLDLILQTAVMNDTMKFLVDNGYVKNDRTEFKKTLSDIWFTQFERTAYGRGSSAFESVFLAENFDSDIIGLHNWIYYAKMEANSTLNHLGFIRHTSLGYKGAVCKVRSSLNGTVQRVTSIFVGTSPEFEIALYTLCFYTLPNHLCPVKLANKDIVITVNAYNISGKNVIVAAYPDTWVEPPPVPGSGHSQVAFNILGVKLCLLILVFSI